MCQRIISMAITANLYLLFVCLLFTNMTLKKGHTARVLLGSTLGQEGPASIRFELRLLFTLLRKKPSFAKNILKLAFFVSCTKNKQVLFTFIYMKSTSFREMVSNLKKKKSNCFKFLIMNFSCFFAHT